MSKLFTAIPDELVVLRQGGVYRQVPLFEYGGHVYAKFGSGFVGLRKPSSNYPTTKADVTYDIESLSFVPLFDDNRMLVPK